LKILSIDQARLGAWSVFDYDKKVPIAYGEFNFPTSKYTFSEAMAGICGIVLDLIEEHDISAVFIEDIQLRKNVDSFKKLAQLQGGLIYILQEIDMVYELVQPSVWQSYCKARGRTAKERKVPSENFELIQLKGSKIMSMAFVKEKFGIETDNDNIADAICIGHWASQNIKIIKEDRA
jgi:Holliday junction resolvasome RuvABC endonuclease subunit